MRKASIKQNHEAFEARLMVLDSVASQILQRKIGNKLPESDALAEGIVLVLAGVWEEVVDDDFVDALNRDTTAYAKHVGIDLPKNLSRDVCFGLLVGDGYLDFRDTGDIIGKARKVLVPANNPFTYLTKTVRKSIDQFYILRNYLSHRSKRAYHSYRALLEDEFGYDRVVRPGVFLRARGDSLGKPRLEFFLRV